MLHATNCRRSFGVGAYLDGVESVEKAETMLQFSLFHFTHGGDDNLAKPLHVDDATEHRDYRLHPPEVLGSRHNDQDERNRE